VAGFSLILRIKALRGAWKTSPSKKSAGIEEVGPFFLVLSQCRRWYVELRLPCGRNVSNVHQQLFKILDDPHCCIAVPFLTNCVFFPLSCHQSCQRRRQLARISSNEFVRPNRYGLGTFVSRPIIAGPSFVNRAVHISTLIGRAGGLSIPANSDTCMLAGNTSIRPA
jgi:hypothetical protein